MNEFTYEAGNEKRIYETYEWDNTWLEFAYDEKIQRVLYIGDSISCGIRRIATQKTDKKLLFDGFGTSKGIDNPYFADSLSFFAKQQPRRNAVLFNNGLHGWHLDDETDYKAYYEKMIVFLLEEFKNTPLFVVLTTHIVDDEREKRVTVRNKIASEIAEKYSLPVIDLYAESLQNKHLLHNDGVHYTEEGYNMLADKILKALGFKG